MTDREKAIVMAHTGISMLEGDKLNVFYRYLTELYGRPVYTHELIALDIEHKSKPDFLKLCDEEEPERKKGKWIDSHTTCSECGWQMIDDVIQTPNMVGFNYCPNCGADMREGEQE